jgi:hypothetical protein
MAIDYGVRRAPRRRILAGAAIAVLALGLAALVAVWSADRATRMSDARAWTVAGPPCATLAAASLAASSEAAVQIETFSGVRFARAHGALRCADIGYDEGRSDDTFPVCQFDHPGGLQVTTPTGTYSFLLPPMRAATIQVRHDVPACVVGSSMEIH